ncbi:hypothetical protein LTR62_008800 [Meristemomyces frigidus]|uniref:Sexual development protein n=1 Tax=Meristemomyces frigidus TaxID=1508187 RepID=A0AAN7TD60_9PEZI|nr:hypothetical protein LTR62_008800 [Meristemomyces frigidus]
MHSNLASTALLGFAAIAAARPYASGQWSGSSTTTSSAAIYSPTGSSSTGQKAFDFPLSNGFPNVAKGSQTLEDIEIQAHGQLSNAPPPPSPPHPDSLVSLGFIAFNELFEVAFFTELISNITNNVPGYDKIPNRDHILDILTIHQAQEELHELNANLAFNAFTGQTIQPCEYIFPVADFSSAIAFASQFTDLVLSTLPDIQTIFGTDGDIGLIRGVGAVIGQEGEQDGFYRDLIGKPPAQLPFLTQGARDFALSAIVQGVAVPGSCPSLDLLTNPDQRSATKGATPLKVFDVLTVVTPASDFTLAHDITASFKAVTAQTTGPNTQTLSTEQSSADLYITYLNQVNVPLSVPVSNLAIDAASGALMFEAVFPGNSSFLAGLTIVAVTNGKDFSSPDAVAAATVFGPALIEID